MNHMPPSCEFYEPFADLPPGTAGSEDCERPFTQLRNQKTIAETYSAIFFSSIQPSLGNNELESVFWPRGTGGPANSLAKKRAIPYHGTAPSLAGVGNLMSGYLPPFAQSATSRSREEAIFYFFVDFT